MEDRRLLAGLQVDFGDLFNQDSIRNFSNGTEDTVDVALDANDSSRLVTNAYAKARDFSEGNGLPDDGFFPAGAFHPDVRLGYNNAIDGNNVAYLPNVNDTVTFAAQRGLFTQIHVFGFSTDGTSQMDVRLSYADGGEVLTTQVEDWGAEVLDDNVDGDAVRYELTSGLDRVTGNSFDNTDGWAVYGHRFSIDASRQLESVTIANTTAAPGNSNLVVLGATLDSSIELSELDGRTGFRLNGAADSDNAGVSVSSAGDVNGDGFDDVLIGARFADPASVDSAGSSYVVFGQSADFNSAVDLEALNGITGFRLDGGEAQSDSGVSVSGAGDVNADGVDDLIVGASDAHPGGRFRAGQAHVVYGRTDGFAPIIALSELDGSTGIQINGIDFNDQSGYSVSNAGDVNGDGIDDLFIGARLADPNDKAQAGESYVVFGKKGGVTSPSELSTLDGSNGFRLEGIKAGDLAGTQVAEAGDINGDGCGDLIVSAYTAGPNEEGETYVVFGKSDDFDGIIDLSSLDGTTGFRLDGIAAADRSGSSVAAAGDVNGDGFDDLIVGAKFADPHGVADAGESYILFGKPGVFAASLDLGTLDGEIGFTLEGVGAAALSGVSVAGAGDVNGDGFDDIVIGASLAAPGGRTRAGQTYVVFGKPNGFDAMTRLDSLDGTNGFRLDGEAAGDWSGGSVSSAGDLNGDGFDDLIIGARYASPRNKLRSGAGYVVFGGNFTGGIETLVGDSEANTLLATQGSAARDILIGGLNNDVLVSDGGSDVLKGGAGDDTLAIPDGDFSSTRRLQGGNGFDTLRLEGSGVTLDLTTTSDNRITGIEKIDISGSGQNVLRLNREEVLSINSDSNTLRVEYEDGDTVIFGSGWTVELPQIVGGQYMHILTQGNATVEVVDRTPFHNPFLPLDTNRDAHVSAIDALIIVNRLNATGSGVLPTPTSLAGLTDFFYVDTNGDRFVAPVDVIRIVNFLNNPATNAEGEFAVPDVNFAVAGSWGPPSGIVADHDDSAPASRCSANLTVYPFPAVESVQNEAPSRVKHLRSGFAYEELVAAVDALFRDGGFDVP